MADSRPDPKDWWGPLLGEPLTPRDLLAARRLRLKLSCEACHHEQDADLQGLINSGRGDVPLIELRFRCSHCGSRKTDWRVLSARKAAAAKRPGS